MRRRAILAWVSIQYDPHRKRAHPSCERGAGAKGRRDEALPFHIGTSEGTGWRDSPQGLQGAKRLGRPGGLVRPARGPLFLGDGPEGRGCC